MTEPKWITIGKSMVGLLEGPGFADNPKVVALYARAGHPEVKHDSVAWCAAFVGACLADAGIKPSGSLMALSYKNWGKTLNKPAIGAIGMKRRRGGPGLGHVFFIIGFDATNVFILEGNSNDSVRMGRSIPRNSVIGFRWPIDGPEPDYSPKVIQGTHTAPAKES